MAKARITLTSTSMGTLLLTAENAVWKGDFAWKKERDEVFYAFDWKGDLTLIGEAFTELKNLDDCERVNVEVFRECGGTFLIFWEGYFSKFDATLDYDRCVATVAPKQENEWNCIRREWDDNVNFFSAVTGGKIVTPLAGGGVYEFECCSVTDSNPATTTVPLPCGGATDTCWAPAGVPTVENMGGGNYKHIMCYHRIVASSSTSGQPTGGTGWQLCSTSLKWWRVPDVTEQNLSIFDRGRVFNEVLAYLVSVTGCGLTVRSHFFGINATHTAAPSNTPYTFAAANLKKMILFQKSDIKRPFDSDAATSPAFVMNLKGLLDDLRRMFRVYPKIVGSDLILEHLSYFEALAGPDLSDVPMKLRLDFEKDIQRETKFTWADEVCSTAFAGEPISYACGEGKGSERVSLFSTDVAFIANPLNADAIADSGFVLIACASDGTAYSMIDYNLPLSWPQLHANLHRHGADFQTGSFGGQTTAFSVRKNRKQPAFTVCEPCSGDFDPSKYVTTKLGNGEVQTADYNIFTDSLTIQLNY